MCRLRNIAMCDYQESVTTRQTHRQTLDKVIPMCRYASQTTQKVPYFNFWNVALILTLTLVTLVTDSPQGFTTVHASLYSHIVLQYKLVVLHHLSIKFAHPLKTREICYIFKHCYPCQTYKENLSQGHGKDRESWTRGMTCSIWTEL